MQQCADPGTPNAVPKQSADVLTCYFASVINLGAAFLTHAIESLNARFPRPVKACGHFRPSIREAASGSSAASCRMAAANGRRW
jgi:hypothetical protein